MNLFIFLSISLCCIFENIFCSHVNLSMFGSFTAYILTDGTSQVEHQTKLYDFTDPDTSFETKHSYGRSPLNENVLNETFVNYTMDILNKTLDIMKLVNGSNQIITISKFVPKFNVNRKGNGGDIVEDNKEVSYNIVDSCRELLRDNDTEMESTERKTLLSKINDYRTSQVEHHTKLHDAKDLNSSFEIKRSNIERRRFKDYFINVTKGIGKKSLNTVHTPEVQTSISRQKVVKNGGEEDLYIVDSCRALLRINVTAMEYTERRILLSKINDFTQRQYNKICQQFNYCRTLYEWTRLGKEITTNVGKMKTKKLIEFYGDFYKIYLKLLNVSSIITPEQEVMLRNKTVNLGSEPENALRDLSHYALDIFNQNVTKYYNFTVHLSSTEIDSITYDEWDNLNEDLMAWGIGLREDLRPILERMALLTQNVINSWKPDIVAYIRGDMVEIFKPDDMTI